MNISRLIGILSLIVTVLTTGATLLQAIRPEWAIWALALSAALSSFVERVQGGKSKLEAEQELGFRRPPKER